MERNRLVVRAGATVTAALVALGFGLLLHRLPSLPVAVWLGAGPALVVLGFLVLQGPEWCLAGLLVADVFGLDRYAVALGAVDLRVPDLFYLALFGWAVLERMRVGPAPRRSVGQRQLALWLLVLGVSLYPLVVRGSADTADSVVAWLRLVQTFSLVWLVPYAIRTPRAARFVLGVLGLACTVEVGASVVGALVAGDLTQRLSGANDANTTGLLAAVVILLAVHAPVPRRAPVRALMLLIGIVGLLMTRSLGATVAVAVTLAFSGVRALRVGRPGDGRARGLLAPSRLLVMALLVLGLAIVLRPENVPGSTEFGRSTTMHRTILAAAGLEMFAEHPVLGVGWQQSSREISSRQLNEKLRARFGDDVNVDFFPDRSPTSVHNTYIQILAESGLLGFGAFLALLVVAVRGVRRLLRRVRGEPELFAYARSAALVLVAVLLWWNDNALFGAQPETVLAATFLGILAAVPAVRSGSGQAAPRGRDAARR